MSSLFTIVDTTDSIATVVSTANTKYFIKDTYDGTGDAGPITISVNNVHIELDSGGAIGQNMTLSGDDIHLELFPASTTANITSTGTGNFLEIHNGVVTFDIVQETAGSALTVKGHGFGAEASQVNFKRPDCLAEGLSVWSGGSDSVLNNSIGTRCTFKYLNVIDAGDHGFQIVGNDTILFGNTVQDSSNSGLHLSAQRLVCVANHVLTSDGDALELTVSADNCVVHGNYLNDGATDPININAGATKNVLTANRMVDQASALGGTSTTDSDNDKTA